MGISLLNCALSLFQTRLPTLQEGSKLIAGNNKNSKIYLTSLDRASKVININDYEIAPRGDLNLDLNANPDSVDFLGFPPIRGSTSLFRPTFPLFESCIEEFPQDFTAIRMPLLLRPNLCISKNTPNFLNEGNKAESFDSPVCPVIRNLLDDFHFPCSPSDTIDRVISLRCLEHLQQSRRWTPQGRKA